MLSMVRSELYRIVRSRYAIFYAAVFFVVAVANPLALWLHSVWPAFAEAAAGLVVVPEEPLPSLRLYGAAFVGGSLASMLVGVAVSSFVTEDFKSGFVKNLVQARGGRASYAVAVVACAVAIAVATTLFGTLVIEVALRLQGYVPVPPSSAEALQWFAQVTLCCVAYATVSALVAIATRSETLAVFVAIFLGGGAVESVCQMVLANIPGIPAALRDCLDGYLAADLSTLAQGVVCDPMTYVQAGATVLVAGAACVLVMRRRSLG